MAQDRRVWRVTIDKRLTCAMAWGIKEEEGFWFMLGLGLRWVLVVGCDLSIHRHCTEKIIDVCGRNKDSKRSMRDMIPGRRSQNCTLIINFYCYWCYYF